MFALGARVGKSGKVNVHNFNPRRDENVESTVEEVVEEGRTNKKLARPVQDSERDSRRFKMRPKKNHAVVVAWSDGPPTVGIVIRPQGDEHFYDRKAKYAAVFFAPDKDDRDAGWIETVNHDQIIHDLGEFDLGERIREIMPKLPQGMENISLKD